MPDSLQYRLAEIEVTASIADEKIIGLFRYDAGDKSKLAGKKAPTLVIIAEIASTLYLYEQLLDTINETAEQVRLLTTGVDTDPMTRFEKLVTRLNEAVQRFSEKEPTPIAWNRVNIFVLELSEGGQLCLSGIGRLCNIFLQKQADGTTKMFDLFGSLEQPAEPDPKKPFSSFICGDMKEGDLLFAGTMNFERYRNELAIANTLKSTPPVAAAQEISKELERKGVQDDFAGIIISCTAAQAIPAPTVIATEPETLSVKKSTASVEKLYEEERAAETMLGPALSPTAVHPAGKPLASLTERAKTWVQDLKAQRAMQQSRPATKGRADDIAINSMRGMHAGAGFALTLKHKLLIGVGVVVVVAALGGTWWYRSAQKAAEAQAAWNVIFDQAQDKKNRSDASAVYGNEDQARKLLQEAESLLNGLDGSTPDRATSKQTLLGEIAEMKTKLRREVRIEAPEQLVALPMNAPAGSLQQLALFKGNLYAVDGPGLSVMQVNPTTKEQKKFSLSPEQVPAVGLAAGTDSLILATAGNTWASISPSGNTVKPLTISAAKSSGTRGIAIYNRRPYTLDPDANQVWRWTAASGGYGGETGYIKQLSTSLGNAVGIAIDANIYVALQDGRVIRYYQGNEDPWSLGAADPPVTNIHDVWTAADLDRVVVTDQAGKRILVYRKQDGRLVAQLTSPVLEGPTRVTGDATTKKLYVIDGNKILGFDLP